MVKISQHFKAFTDLLISPGKKKKKKKPVELVLTFSSFSPPSLSRVQQLSSGRQRWGAAGQGEEEQEQWQPQEGGAPEIPEPGGGAAGDPTAAAQDPQQARSRRGKCSCVLALRLVLIGRCVLMYRLSCIIVL